MKLARLLATIVVLLAASTSWAQFRAADMVVIPVAAATPGLNSSNWHTDLEILNVDTVPIDVSIVFIPTGNTSHVTWYNDIANALGGRESDGFGHIDASLADIQPGRSVIIDDIIRSVWGDGYKGPLILFAYEAGSLNTTTPPGGIPRAIVATSRTYTLATDADGNESTYGQEIPGLPWYDYIDPQATAKGFDHVTFTGIREDARYRTALGLFNVSDRLTTLRVVATLTAADGTEIRSVGFDLQPLGHVQYDQAVRTLFGMTEEDLPSLAGATIKVSVANFATGANDPTPALMAYVSRIDNATNDPVYLEQRFSVELPWDCVFNDNCSSSSASAAWAPPWVGRRHPLGFPSALR